MAGAGLLSILGLILALAALAGFAVYRQAVRIATLAAERDALARQLRDLGATLGTAPAALYLFQPRSERFFPAPFLALNKGEQGFTPLLEKCAPADMAALDHAVARLRTDGTAFSLSVHLAATGDAIDVSGQRLAAPDGALIADAVWFSDARAREAAERESRRWSAFVDALPLPVWRRRAADLALISGNRAFAASGGVPADGGLRALGGDDAGRALAGAAREKGRASESRHVVVNGSRRLLELCEVGVPESGELLGMARDLTELEAIETELKQVAAAHAAVLERIAAAVVIYGADRRLSFFNTAFAQLWHLEEDWLSIGPLIEEVMDRLRERRRLPEVADFGAFRRQLVAQFTSLITPQEELLHLPDGRTLRGVVSPHPLGGLIFAYEDVSDRLALERSYNTLIDVQRETLDHLQEGIAVFGSDGRLKLSNPAYARIWQLSPEEIAGEQHVSQIAERLRGFFDSGRDWPEQKARVIARLTADRAASTRLERRDGSVVHAVTVPLPDGNTMLSYVDITDSIRVEHALRERNEALEEAGRLKSEFLANVSYELRTPLTSITGYAEMLTDSTYSGPLTPRQREYSQHILDSARAFTSLVDDILDLATIEAGYMRLNTGTVDIHPLLASVLTLTQAQARSIGLRLELDCPSDIGTLLADERRLKQVLFSLVSNALKFTPAGGTVTLRARRAEGRVALIVADTGMGVPAGDQTRIFEKFERANPQARQPGAGLGLALVKSFVELHGGTVELESRPGEGTVVTCWLNTETPPQIEPVAAAAASQAAD